MKNPSKKLVAKRIAVPEVLKFEKPEENLT
jgi:hypothetical protein